MPNKKDRRLQELAAIAQLYTSLQAPQMRQQEGQQQNALGILGLLMQQQGKQQGLAQDQKQFDATQKSAEAQRAMIAQQHQNTTNAQASRDLMEAAYKQQGFEADNQYRQNALNATATGQLQAATADQAKLEEAKRANQTNVATQLFGDIARGGMSPESLPQLLSIAGLADPRFAEQGNKMIAGQRTQFAEAMKPQVDSMRGTPAFDSLRPAFAKYPGLFDEMATPASGRDWSGGAAIMPRPGIMPDRQGGMVDSASQALSGILSSLFPNAQQRQQNQQFNMNDPLNPMNILFGRKIQ